MNDDIWLRLCSTPPTMDEMGRPMGYDGYCDMIISNSPRDWVFKQEGDVVVISNRQEILFPECGPLTPLKNSIPLMGFELFKGESPDFHNRIVARIDERGKTFGFGKQPKFKPGELRLYMNYVI